MRIIVATLYHAIGGSTIVLLAAADALRVDHEVIVRAPIDRADNIIPRAVSALSLESWWQKLAMIPSLCRAVVSEALWFRRCRPDIIYVHDDLSLYVYSLLAWLYSAKVVWHVHMRSGPRILERLRSKLAHHVIHISEHARGSTGLRVIRNAVRNIVVQRWPEPGLLVVAGSICELKNQLLAVETLALLRARGFEGKLRLCGSIRERDYLPKLQQRVADLDLEDLVVFAGFVDPKDYLATAACLLMTSSYENQPLALIEAIVAQVPVVATDIVAHRELVELGCLSADALCPATAEKFAAAVLVQLKHNVALATCARRARELFSQDRFDREIREYFRDLEQGMALQPSPT